MKCTRCGAEILPAREPRHTEYGRIYPRLNVCEDCFNETVCARGNKAGAWRGKGSFGKRPVGIGRNPAIYID